jgi:hypothetical protein
MAFRTAATAKVQSTTQAQPWIGSWITASSAPMNGPTTAPITLTLGTADDGPNTDALDFFNVGDPVLIINPTGTNAEKCRIASIPSGGGDTVILGPQNDYGNYYTRFAHPVGAFGTGAFIALALPVNNIAITFEDGATGQWLYLGNQWNMTALYRRFWKLAKVAANSIPTYFSATETFFGAPFDTSELWALGTNVGDLFTVSFNVL